MQLSKYDVAALWTLLAWSPLPGIAVLHALCIVFGYYDPARDDGLSAAHLPYYWCNLGSQILVGIVVTVSLFLRVCDSSKSTSARILGRKVMIGWIAQIVIFIAVNCVSGAIVYLRAE